MATSVSEERKIDADYVPCYSNLSTSDSDISRVSRSRSCTRRSIDTVQRYSDNIIRRPSQRRASVHAKARLRDQLVSDQDRQDASYNGGQFRRDTPQVSPNIPMNPDTPAGAAYWQRPFAPTNDLVLTRPATHQSNDSILNDMLRRFESSAETAATIEALRAVSPKNEKENDQTSPSGPSRRSFLRPALRPISVSQSAYPPPHGFKTWRKFPDTPAKPVIVRAESGGEASPVSPPKSLAATDTPAGAICRDGGDIDTAATINPQEAPDAAGEPLDQRTA